MPPRKSAGAPAPVAGAKRRHTPEGGDLESEGVSSDSTAVPAQSAAKRRFRGRVLRGDSFVNEYSVGDEEKQQLFSRMPTMIRSGDTLIPEGPPSDESRYLVVFDLDETIVYARKGPLVLRPHARELLQMCGEKCELAMWTAGARQYAKAVLHELNRVVWPKSSPESSPVRHLITRSKEWFSRASYTKDLRKLGRRLDKVLIIENSPDCVRLNPENAIVVDDFDKLSEGQPTMRALAQVIEELVGSGKPVQEYLPSSPLLNRQQVEGHDGKVEVYYLHAGEAQGRKVVQTNKDRAPASKH
eukprot:Hpha_TRINITY_DN30939_c0_g1::TRINITY_DN30939_c0_g1_i1::g.112230::m.112230/K15731/CTDSP; carboxy-terminal domain RNA polymerase II polypeptide A small phosphatase